MAEYKKKFILNFESGLSEQHKKWAKEAVKEFIALFPEYEDCFEISQEKNRFTKEQAEEFLNEIRRKNPNVTDAQLSSLIEKQPDGSYLYKWGADYIFQKSSTDEKLDLLKWPTVDETLHPSGQTAKDPLNIYISNRETTFAYGRTSAVGNVCISAPEADKIMPEHRERHFKDIILHEMGHHFGAVNSNSPNAIDDLGWHSTDPDCLMYHKAYTKEAFLNRHSSPEKPLFSQECMNNMRHNMEQHLGFTQKQQRPADLTISDTEENLPPVSPKQVPIYKKHWREFAQSVAEKIGAEYEENTEVNHFSAQLKNRDNSFVQIAATSETNVSLSAKDKNGEKAIPPLKVFKELAAKAASENKPISFGSIQDAEFKARLLIACMESNPPVKMQNAPEINEEFLAGLDKNSAQKLRSLQNKEQTVGQPLILNQLPKKQRDS